MLIKCKIKYAKDKRACQVKISDDFYQIVFSTFTNLKLYFCLEWRM